MTATTVTDWKSQLSAILLLYGHRNCCLLYTSDAADE